MSMPQDTGQQLKNDMIRDTARLIAQQDYLGRPFEAHLSKAAEIVEQQIRQGIYADPLAKYDMAALISSCEQAR